MLSRQPVINGRYMNPVRGQKELCLIESTEASKIRQRRCPVGTPGTRNTATPRSRGWVHASRGVCSASTLAFSPRQSRLSEVFVAAIFTLPVRCSQAREETVRPSLALRKRIYEKEPRRPARTGLTAARRSASSARGGASAAVARPPRVRAFVALVAGVKQQHAHRLYVVTFSFIRYAQRCHAAWHAE